MGSFIYRDLFFFLFLSFLLLCRWSLDVVGGGYPFMITDSVWFLCIVRSNRPTDRSGLDWIELICWI